MKVAIRLYRAGVLESEEQHEINDDNLAELVRSLAEKHAALMVEKPGMAEIEFLDEPNPKQRFFRIGTDPSGMVWPVRLDPQ